MNTTKKFFFSFLTFIVFNTSIFSQFLEIGTSIGTSSYQGDISPLGWRLSFQGGRLAQGLLVGYSLNDMFSVKLSYFHTHLAASDEDAVDSWRKSRNLSFRTRLQEIAINLDIEPLDFFFKSYKLKPQLHLGVGVFKFNPQAKYDGIYRDLQPLSTEGQGLPGSGKSPYNLTQISIPIGIGLKYYISDDLNIEFSFNPRKTFTDYLDDVSESYYDYHELLKYKGSLAAELAFRGDEIDNSITYPNNEIGRGNNNENDWYIFNTFTIMYRFKSSWPFKSSRKVKCPY